jgi:molybdopterin converting factor small subunit
MNVPVRLFARARDVVGKDVVLVELQPGSSVGDMRRRLEAKFPQLKSLLERSALAVNDEFADDSSTIPSNAEVALLPPVSGGS